MALAGEAKWITMMMMILWMDFLCLENRREGKVATNDNLDGMTVNGRTVFRQIGWKWAWAKTTTTTTTRTKHGVAINRYKIY